MPRRPDGRTELEEVTMSNIPRPWSESEDTLLLRFYFTHTRKEIARMLGRSDGSLRKRCSVLGLNQKHPAVQEFELDIIREWYVAHVNDTIDRFGLDQLAQQLGRTRQFICRLAGRMGLTQIDRSISHEEAIERGKKTSKAWATKGHPRGMLGKTHSDENKKKQSKRTKKMWDDMTPLDLELRKVKRNKTTLERYGTGNPSMRGQNPYSRTKSGKRADLDNRFFRSSWEANYARYLNWLKAQGKIKSWEYEPQTFVFHGIVRGVLTYTPDFKVFDCDGSYAWHEVKGWMDAKSKAKLKRMTKFYPEEIVIVVGPAEYKEVSKWSRLIPGWE
jgi:hypothetical protein